MRKKTNKGATVGREILAQLCKQLLSRNPDIGAILEILSKNPSILKMKCVHLQCNTATGPMNAFLFKDASGKIFELGPIYAGKMNKIISFILSHALPRQFFQDTGINSVRIPIDNEDCSCCIINVEFCNYILFLQSNPDLIRGILNNFQQIEFGYPAYIAKEIKISNPLDVIIQDNILLQEKTKSHYVITGDFGSRINKATATLAAIERLRKILPHKIQQTSTEKFEVTMGAIFSYLSYKLGKQPSKEAISEAKNTLSPLIKYISPVYNSKNLILAIATGEQNNPLIEYHTVILKFLLNDLRISPNVQREDGMTPLMIYCNTGNIDAVRLLLEYKADPNVQRHDGMTPLMLCCYRGNIDAARLLLEYKAHVNIGYGAEGIKTTALTHAISNLHGEIAKLLINFGAEVDGVALIHTEALKYDYVLSGGVDERGNARGLIIGLCPLSLIMIEILKIYALKQIQLEDAQSSKTCYNLEIKKTTKEFVETSAKEITIQKDNTCAKAIPAKPQDHIESGYEQQTLAPNSIAPELAVEEINDGHDAIRENRKKLNKVLQYHKSLQAASTKNTDVKNFIEEALFSYLASEDREVFLEHVLPTLLEGHDIVPEIKALAASLGIEEFTSAIEFFQKIVSDYTLASKYFQFKSQQNQLAHTADEEIISWFIDGKLYTSKTEHVFEVLSKTKDKFFISIPDDLWEKYKATLEKLNSKDLKIIPQDSKATHGLKLLQNKIWELKLLGADLRLSSNKMYKNSKGDILIRLDGDTGHDDVMRLLRDAGQIETIYVSDTVDKTQQGVPSGNAPPPSDPDAVLADLMKNFYMDYFLMVAKPGMMVLYRTDFTMCQQMATASIMQLLTR